MHDLFRLIDEIARRGRIMQGTPAGSILTICVIGEFDKGDLRFVVSAEPEHALALFAAPRRTPVVFDLAANPLKTSPSMAGRRLVRLIASNSSENSEAGISQVGVEHSALNAKVEMLSEGGEMPHPFLGR